MSRAYLIWSLVLVFLGFSPSLFARTIGVGGELLFFPDKAERPKDDRHWVVPGQEIPFCLKFKTGNSDFLQKLKAKATGLKIFMEDNEVPPHQIVIQLQAEDGFLQEEQDCYRGVLVLSPAVKPSIYQIADLLILSELERFYPLREKLYAFTQADELHVQALAPDAQFKLSKITSERVQIKGFRKKIKIYRIKIKQTFSFEDPYDLIQSDSIQVFYQRFEENRPFTYHEAKCRLWRKSQKFYKEFRCQLTLAEPYFLWEERRVRVVLDSLGLKDKAGNYYSYSDPNDLKTKAQDHPIEFWFANDNSSE